MFSEPSQSPTQCEGTSTYGILAESFVRTWHSTEFYKAVAQAQKIEINSVHALPPLILHPFTESAATAQVLESARASLSIISEETGTPKEKDALERQMIEGRFTEFRMLFYVGKDICRWLDQCVDTCGRDPELMALRLPAQSFARLLIEQTPEDVATKLRGWGVVEYARIFSRSIGIFTQFRQPPTPEILQPRYLRHYYRYADFAYTAWRDLEKGPELQYDNFPFALFASGEYTRKLEEEWRES